MLIRIMLWHKREVSHQKYRWLRAKNIFDRAHQWIRLKPVNIFKHFHAFHSESISIALASSRWIQPVNNILCGIIIGSNSIAFSGNRFGVLSRRSVLNNSIRCAWSFEGNRNQQKISCGSIVQEGHKRKEPPYKKLKEMGGTGLI